MRPGRWGVTAGVALIALGLLSFNAFALFTGSVAPETDITAGTMTITLGDPGDAPDPSDYVTVAASNIAPGDSIERVLNLTTGGTVSASDMKLTVTDDEAPDSILFTGESDDTTALTLLVQRCSVAWTTSAHPYTCSGATTNLWPADGSADPINDAADVSLTGELVDGNPNRVRVLMVLPSGADDSFQSETAQIQFGFSLVQRAGTYK